MSEAVLGLNLAHAQDYFFFDRLQQYWHAGVGCQLLAELDHTAGDCQTSGREAVSAYRAVAIRCCR
ncbi:MAG: hypothetical protein AB2654_19435 [Candidatus Thiodiazotropha sp.]